MGQLLGFRIQNYRALADVTVGKVKWNQGEALGPVACFIGTNGCGKSTLLDALGFLRDCLLEGVEAACDKQQRGGFENLRTQGKDGPIAFTLYFRGDESSRAITYELSIDLVGSVPCIVAEKLLQGSKSQQAGAPSQFLKIEKGAGVVWGGDATSADKASKREKVRLADQSRLAIATLGALKDHPRIARFRSYLESWYLSYFVPEAARERPPAGAQRWLDRKGANVANVLQYFQREHDTTRFEEILARVAEAIPGVTRIEAKPSEDRHLLLAFHMEGYDKPFFQASMSDGTLKMLAYAVLLADPEPRPFQGIEEPENGLHHALHATLARAFLDQASTSGGRTQTLLTTHSPYLVDGLRPEHVWIMKKVKGLATVQRVADIETIDDLVEEGIPLGSLWYSNHFDEERVGARGGT